MSFFKQKVNFSSKCGSFFSVMRDNSSFLAETLFYMLLTKVAHQRASFQTCLLTQKFTILMSFLESRISFSSNFASLFSVMRHNSSVLFHLNLCMLLTKRAHQSKFQTFTARMEINIISHVIFQATSQFL